MLLGSHIVFTKHCFITLGLISYWIGRVLQASLFLLPSGSLCLVSLPYPTFMTLGDTLDARLTVVDDGTTCRSSLVPGHSQAGQTAPERTLRMFAPIVTAHSQRSFVRSFLQFHSPMPHFNLMPDFTLEQLRNFFITIDKYS